MKSSLLILGYLFIAVVSILSAIAVESIWLRILLFAAALVSLVLAVKNVFDSKKMKKEIEELKKNQLSVSVNGSTLVFKTGET